jgi:preprotein translocase SecE subunit
MALANEPNPRRVPGSRRADKANAAAVPIVNQTTVTEDPTMNKFQEFSRYLKQTRIEWGRVTWPDRKTLQRATGVVLMTLIVFSVYLGFLDVTLGKVFGLGHVGRGRL